MPLALIIIGIAMLIAGARGNGGALGKQVATDFSGGFLLWVGAIVIIGMIGNISVLQKPSRMLLVLIVLVFVLRNGGLFQQTASAFEVVPKSDGTNYVNYVPPQTSSGSGGGGVLGDVGKAVGIVSTIASFFG